MQARAAYIRSIGTTGILVAAALLMLATVSALVAYDGWPGGAEREGVTSVPVQTPRDVDVVRQLAPLPAPATKLVARAAASAESPVAGLVRDVSARGRSNVGLVKVPPTPPGVVAPAPEPAPAAPGAVQEPPPVTEPAPPARPEVPLPEPVPGTVDNAEEMAYGVLGTALPVADEPSGQPTLGLDLGDLTLPLP